MTERRVVLATPHTRNDSLEQLLRSKGAEVLRVRTNEELSMEALQEFSPSWVFFPHWSERIGREIHERYRCVIFHMTDLPFGRGGSPLQNLIARGLTETTMSAIVCTEEMDAGDVYLKAPLSLLGTAEEILLRANSLIGSMILQLLDDAPVPVPQVGTPTVFKRRRPRDGAIPVDADLETVFDTIRMLDADGYPRAFLRVGDLRLEFSRASLGVDKVDADVRIRIQPAADDRGETL